MMTDAIAALENKHNRNSVTDIFFIIIT